MTSNSSAPLRFHLRQTLTQFQRNYQVVGSVRSEEKAQEILQLHPSWKSHLSFVYIKDIGVPGAFDKVFQDAKSGFDYIIHTASPVTFNVQDIQKDLIDPAVKG
jgi:nucleoside-diphosphate-sugar epimerase